MVDDVAKNLLALETILADLDQNLVRATSGEQALKCVLQQEFAVILLDVQMPGMDGYETAELIRQRDESKHTPIIFVTATNNDESAVHQGYALGAVDYIFKPIVPDVLKAKVNVFVDLFMLRLAERQRLEEARNRDREQYERELAMIERVSAARKTGVTAGMFGQVSVREGQPESFGELVQSYDRLIELALDQRTFKVEHNLSDQLRSMADQLGSLGAVPRDVVEVHTTALNSNPNTPSAKKQARTEEARFLVLELMGHLCSHYRRHSTSVSHQSSVRRKNECYAQNPLITVY